MDKPRSSAADYLHLLDLRSEATKFKKSKISATKVWVSIRGENYVAVLDGKTFKERPARAASGHAIHATNTVPDCLMCEEWRCHMTSFP